MTKTTIDGVSVWVTEQLNASDVVQGRGGEEGFVTLRFRHGPVVGIDFKSHNRIGNGLENTKTIT